MIESKKIVKLNSTKEKVWNILTNNQDYTWRSDLSKIEIVNDKKFIEYDKKGFPTEFIITNKEPYKLYEFDIQNSNLSGHWIGEIKPITDQSIELKLTEKIQNTNIPSFIVKLYLSMQQKKYIKDFKKKLKNI